MRCHLSTRLVLEASLALALVLGAVGCKSEIEFVRKEKKSDKSGPQGADDAIPVGPKTPPGPGSGTPAVGDDSFRAGTDAPDAEVVTENPSPSASPPTTTADDDDDDGATAGPGPAPSPTTAGNTTAGTTSDGATTAGPGPGPGPSPTTAGATTDGATTASPTTAGATTDGATTATPTTAGATTASPTTAGATTATPTAGPTTAGGTTDGGTTGGSGGPKEHPTQILVVDWGSLITFYWKIPGASSANVLVESQFSTYKREYPVPEKDIPDGIWPLDTHLLEPGTYLVTLIVKYPKFEERHRVRLRVRPLLELIAVQPELKPRKDVPYPIWVKVAAGASRVRLYLNGANRAFLSMKDLARGRHPATVTPDRDGDNMIVGTVKKNGVRGRDARLVVEVLDQQNPPGGPYPPGQNPPGGPYPPGQNPPEPYPPGQTPPSPYPPGQTPPTPYPPGQTPPGGPYPPPPPPPLPEDPEKIAIPLHLVDLFPGNCQRLEWRGVVGSIDHAEGVKCKGPGDLTARHDWYAAKQFRMPLSVIQGTLHRPHSGLPLPKDVTNDGYPDFPTLDYASLKTKVSGVLTSTAVAASSWHDAQIPSDTIAPRAQRNVVIVGDAAHPFQIDGEVLVQGDLVIKGRFVGNGTIYVSGNVYIPHDLIATNTAFPFSENETTASTQGKDRVNGAKDSLAIVAAGMIFAGDNYPQYANPLTNPYVQAMYGWYPGGKVAFKRLYEPVWNCQTNTMPSFTKAAYEHCDCNVHGGFNVIEANLYAWKGVRGSSGAWKDANTYVPNSYAIDGTVLTTSFDIVTTPDLCATPNNAHPVHGYPQGKSYVNFDYRLLHGLKAFSQLKPAFKGN